MSVFFELIYRFFDRMGIFSITWQEAALIALSVVLILLAFLKIFPPYIAVPFSVGMILANITGSFAALPALSLNSELAVLLVILYFWCKGADTEFSWVIRKPSLLLFGITAQTGFFLVLAAPFLFSGDTLPKSNAVPFLVFIYASLLPVMQKPVTRFMISGTASAAMPPESQPVSAGKRLTAMLLVVLVIGMLVPAALPLAGVYLFGCILKFPKYTSAVQVVLWLCIGLCAHGSIIFREDVIRLIFLGAAALLVSSLFGGLLSRLMITLSDGRMHSDKLSKAIEAASVLGVLIAAGVLLTVC